MRIAKTARSSSTGSAKVGPVLRLTPFHGIAVFNSAVGDVGLSDSWHSGADAIDLGFGFSDIDT